MNSDNQHFNSALQSFLPVLARIPDLVDEKAQPGITPDQVSDAMQPAPLENKLGLQQAQARDEAQKALGDREIHQPAMRFEIPAVPTPPTETTDGFFRQRPWQLLCSAELAGHRNFILNAPTAAGKTFELCTIAAERLNRDENLRVVIAAPQGIIVAGFRENKIEMPDGARVHWQVRPGHDLCGEKSQRRAARLLKFLAGPTSTNAMDRVALCTHATLVRAFSKNSEAFKNVLIIIDEAHHIQHGTTEDRQFDISNKLGGLVKHALQHRDVIQVGLATATFFRGDRTPIIPDGAEFGRFDLAYDEYLMSCRFLRGFSYDFVLSGSSFVDALKNLLDRKIRKTIVYIPAVNSSSSLGTKTEDVNGVLKAIAGTETPILADTDQPIMRVQRGDQWIKVVNLVDEVHRAEKTEAIIAVHNAPDPGHIDVVIALGMLKEGANWRWADREVIIGQRGSLTEILQMVGRILRDVSGKTNVEVFHLLPFRFDQTDKEGTRQNLNDYLKAILLSMLLENVVSPAYLPAANSDPRQDGGRQRINYLKEAFADEGQATAALAEITSRVVEATAGDSTSQGIQRLTGAFPAIVSDVLAARGVHEFHDEIARQVFRMFNRRTVALDGLNVGRVDVELIKENPFGCLLQYASDACGIKTFRDLRVASCARAFLPFATARVFVHGLRLKSVHAWLEYCASGKRPPDIPSNPDLAYEHDGWRGFGDWLGTGTVNLADRIYRPFREAREFVHTLHVKSQPDWRRYCKSGEKSADIPSRPDLVYADQGWSGYGDWLGTDWRKYRPFQEAREFVRRLQLKSIADWTVYCKTGGKPADIPTCPHVVYRQAGWIGLGDWLGTGAAPRIKKAFRPFHEARKYVHSLQLRSHADWRAYCKSGAKPVDIPYNPGTAYGEDGWKDLGDWLGTGTVANRYRRFRSFQEARQFVRCLGFASVSEWLEYRKSGERPTDIPTNPNIVYKDSGWAGFSDWLMGESGVASAAA